MQIISMCLIISSSLLNVKCCKEGGTPMAQSRFPSDTLSSFFSSGMNESEEYQYSADDYIPPLEEEESNSSNFMGTSMFDLVNSFLNAKNSQTNETNYSDLSKFASLLTPLKEKSGNNLNGLLNSANESGLINNFLNQVNSQDNKTDGVNLNQFAALFASLQGNSKTNLTDAFETGSGNESDALINAISSMFNPGNRHEGSGKIIDFREE